MGLFSEIQAIVCLKWTISIKMWFLSLVIAFWIFQLYKWARDLIKEGKKSFNLSCVLLKHVDFKKSYRLLKNVDFRKSYRLLKNVDFKKSYRLLKNVDFKKSYKLLKIE